MTETRGQPIASESARSADAPNPGPRVPLAGTLRVTMGSVERRGPWTVPERLDVRVRWGNCELDLRQAELGALTTIDVSVMMGNIEIIVPPDLAVEVRVDTAGGNCEESRGEAVPEGAKRVVITGKVTLGNCEVIALHHGETLADHARRQRHELRRHRHMHHHHRMRALHAERDLWRTHPDRSPWVPWWLQARMRRRIFSWFAIAFVLGVVAGVHFWADHRWWHFALAALGLSMMSGAVAWRLTRPLILVIQAARDIGDGKLDTRLDTRQRGEMKVLASAINDMAARIETQMKDQRQLLAAVSHELRTPLGHMRVLIETARAEHERNTPGSSASSQAERKALDAPASTASSEAELKALAELDREVTTLDDLVGRLLASSRLEFGNLDRRTLDLGELVSDIATSAGIAPEAIEAIGDVKAAIDPTLIRRAVANLIDNANTHAGGAVAVRIVRRGAQVAVEVDDAGPGVPADQRADAFRAFSPSSGGGLGLGLALVSRIAVAHDGGAWITERPGGGARVGFTVGV